jgi:hypothetical protein
MPRSRTRRNLPSLHTEERAIISTMDSYGEGTAASKCYGKALSLSAGALHILADDPVPMGELLEISISLQGQDLSHSLKGVARTVTACDHQPGYVVGIEIVPDNHAARWQRQFH